ncbi:MAG: TspO/MBR family protein [Methanothrix sp.]|jgi:tryptophan-rich sensory protein|uniref:Integral membrane protein n=1 Tax=Methanothrix harundinacea TaxID=301375 RepID=A0A101FW47_9EURY|nr:MAG: TspO protein [Methanosaeta sp. SDB]KUK45571.1 MAG: Integral membrane protein [Methanothrix harundinacea]MDD3710198.1 tryptophan-rich sensory protein [Methanothrix sp.]MDI9398142.1 TspO/MBR family protein [Euryarchaeota archaeon]KUK96799.1 MAG: Integral membrane protein [Methanothrix harundinacea]
MRRADLIKLAASLGACYLAAFLGSIFTMPNVPVWYASLARPFFAPPGWVFAPVWTALYTLMGLSAYLILREGMNDPKVKPALSVFVLQLVVNVSWSAAFFGLRSPLAGLAVIVLLWALIALTIQKFWAISRTAGALLLPYLIWVSFAAILNFGIWRLNP